MGIRQAYPLQPGDRQHTFAGSGNTQAALDVFKPNKIELVAHPEGQMLEKRRIEVGLKPWNVALG